MADQKKLNNLLARESESGCTDAVKALLDAGADVHARDDWALRYASARGYTETVNLLINAGANVHARGDVALRYASQRGHTETVRELLKAGADVHSYQDEALHMASAYGRTETVKLLREWIEGEKDASPPDRIAIGEAEYASWASVTPATSPVLSLPVPIPPRQISNLRLPDPL